MSLDGLSSIDGPGDWTSFIAENCSQVSAISSGSLELVGASLNIVDMPRLVTISFSNLSWIGGELNLANNPMLEELTLPSSITIGQTFPNSASVSVWNTSLSRLDEFMTGALQDVVIRNNPNMNYVNITATQILLQKDANYTSGNLSICGNGPNVQMAMPNLIGAAGDIWLGNCSSLSAPNLKLANGSLHMLNATSPTLSFPALENINRDLNVRGSFSRYVRATTAHGQETSI